MPHTRKEMLSWAKDVWEKITGKKEEEVTIKGWVARDESEMLFFFTEKPRKCGLGIWRSQNFFGEVSGVHFPSIRLEDTEPTPCEITIKIKK